MKRIVRIFALFIAVLSVLAMGAVVYGTYAMPSEIVSYNRDATRLSALYSFGESRTDNTVSAHADSRETVRALGVIPVKNVRVREAERAEVFVSGEIFGIKLYTDGVLVVGTQSVDIGGDKVNPAQEAGIMIGDILVSINNTRVFTSDEVTAIFNDNNGKPYTVKLKRDGRYRTFQLKPAYSPREGCYKAGLWVRDSGAGIGTMTFYNSRCGTFAALGHQINDVDTNAAMPLLQGEAVGATVTKVQRGGAGATGSLWCDFEDYTMGRLLANAPSGLYGAYSQIGDQAQRAEIAAPQETQRGMAEIIATVDGKTPRHYEIEITGIGYHRGEEQKDIVFRVTDSALLEKTGGIVQGMSGSPILQNGRLVGAVTHVIVNHPEKGYAIFAQTMLDKSEHLD